MDNTTLTVMFGLVESLSRKEQFRGPELMCYIRGLEFAEKYFKLNSMIIEKQIEKDNEGYEATIES